MYGWIMKVLIEVILGQFKLALSQNKCYLPIKSLDLKLD